MNQGSRIKPLTGGTGSNLNVEFSPDEVAAIDEMLGNFGDTREGVVFKAVSLLYTIFREDPQAETVFLQRGTKRTVIPLR